MFTWLAQQTRRLTTGYPTNRTPEDHNAWLSEQIKAYATPQPYAAPLTSAYDNPTGETWEIREGYRRFAFKEPSVKAALMTKMLAVSQLNLVSRPCNATDKQDRKIAQWVKWAITKSMGGPAALVQKIGIHSLIDGFSVTEKVQKIVEETEPEYGGFWTLKTGKTKDTKGIRFRLNLFKEVVGVRSMIAAQGGQEFPPSDFLIFTHLPLFESPFGISDLRAANRAANLIEAAIKLRAILLENFSGPYLIGKSDDPAARQKMMAVMKDARARGWILIPEGASLEVMNLATSAPDQFQNTIEDLRQEIVTAIQGAYLQLLEGGVADGRGNTEVHKGVSQLFQWWLATCISSVINESLVPDLVYPNFGYSVGLPTVSLGGADPKSTGAELDRFKKGQDLGIVLSKRQVQETADFESPEDEADELHPPNQQGQQQAGDPNAAGAGFDLSGLLDDTPDDPDIPRTVQLEPKPGDDGKGGGSNGTTGAPNTFPAADRNGSSGVVREYSETEYASMKLADRSHLVKKIIEDKNGQHRTVWVNPDTGDHGTEEERLRPRTEAAAALAHALANPRKLTPAHLKALPDHLRVLTKEQKKDVLRSLKLHVSDSKQHLVKRLVAYAEGKPQPKRPEGADSLYKAVIRSGGIDPKSYAFLGHYAGVREAIQDGLSLGLFRSRAGTSKDGKKGQGLDQLAQELHGMGYISEPDTGHLLEQLRKGARSAFSSGERTLKEIDRRAEKEAKEAHDWAEAHPEDAAREEAARARVARLRSELKAKRNEPAADEPTKKNPPAEIVTDPKKAIELQADAFEKQHGWKDGFTREQFMKNWKKTLKDSAPDPATAAALAPRIQSAFTDYDIPNVPVIVRKITGDQQQGQNAHWDSSGFVVVSHDIADEDKYRSAVKPLTDPRKSTVADTYPDRITGVMVHELGHKHHDDNPETVQNARFILADKENQRYIAENISNYASTHPTELIAEAYAMSKHKDYHALPDATKYLVQSVLDGRKWSKEKDAQGIEFADATPTADEDANPFHLFHATLAEWEYENREHTDAGKVADVFDTLAKAAKELNKAGARST